MADTGVSRQRRWQIKMKASGRCVSCGKARTRHAALCTACRAVQNDRAASRYHRKKLERMREERAAGVTRRRGDGPG